MLIGGRLPIHIWPRQMMWAFEWFEPSKPLTLRRGEPWFYVRFETFDPTRPVRLFEAEMTPELARLQKWAERRRQLRQPHLFAVQDGRVAAAEDASQAQSAIASG